MITQYANYVFMPFSFLTVHKLVWSTHMPRRVEQHDRHYSRDRGNYLHAPSVSIRFMIRPPKIGDSPVVSTVIVFQPRAVSSLFHDDKNYRVDEFYSLFCDKNLNGRLPKGAGHAFSDLMSCPIT